MDSSTQARLEQERNFHNDRFTHETRDAQGKYYAAIKHGAVLFDKKLMELSKNADVLEYGCGSDGVSYHIAPVAKSVVGIDISDVAVAVNAEKSKTLGLHNSRFAVMNAEAMDFAPKSFDLVFGRGILHHLDLEKSYSEIARVLRDDGTALFWEPLGHNFLINRYRDYTPHARTVDEHPLLREDFDITRKYFKTVEIKFYGLTTLLSVPFRDSALGDLILKGTSVLDDMLFALPNMKWQAWYSLITLKNPVR